MHSYLRILNTRVIYMHVIPSVNQMAGLLHVHATIVFRSVRWYATEVLATGWIGTHGYIEPSVACDMAGCSHSRLLSLAMQIACFPALLVLLSLATAACTVEVKCTFIPHDKVLCWYL
jgi:hypothetical protein